MTKKQTKREKTSIPTLADSHEKIGPLTKSLSGIVKLPNDFDEKEFMTQVFMEKYGLVYKDNKLRSKD